MREQQRESVYEIRVFESEPKSFAFVGLNSRVALLISDAALILLSSEELQASVAHEAGHEYTNHRLQHVQTQIRNQLLQPPVLLPKLLDLLRLVDGERKCGSSAIGGCGGLLALDRRSNDERINHKRVCGVYRDLGL